MSIDEKALQAAIAWYWRAGAISENIPRGCIREYLANLQTCAESQADSLCLSEATKDQPVGCRAAFEKWLDIQRCRIGGGTPDGIAFLYECWQAAWEPMRESNINNDDGAP